MSKQTELMDESKLLLYKRLASSMKICSNCGVLSFKEDELCAGCKSNQFHVDSAEIEEKVIEMYENQE